MSSGFGVVVFIHKTADGQTLSAQDSDKRGALAISPTVVLSISCYQSDVAGSHVEMCETPRGVRLETPFSGFLIFGRMS